MAAAWSTQESPGAVSFIPVSKSWYGLPVMIHWCGLNMRHLPKACGTVWGSCGNLRKEGLTCGSSLLRRQQILRFQVPIPLPVTSQLPVLSRSEGFKLHTPTSHHHAFPITMEFVFSNHELKPIVATLICFVNYLVKGCGISMSWQCALFGK